MNAVDGKCCRVYVSVSQMAGLNTGDSVQWGVWIQKVKEKEKGRTVHRSDQEPSYVLGAGPMRKGVMY